jgi:hypothetical protein
VKPVGLTDEKLYKMKAEYYGGGLHRAFGLLLHSVAKGVGFALLVGFFFLSPRVSFRYWVTLLLPVAFVCTIWVAAMDRRLCTGEIEIYPDGIIRHSGERTVGIGRSEVRSIKEGNCWTAFGRVSGLAVRSKGASIFIPTACPDYAEIKSRLAAWRP